MSAQEAQGKVGTSGTPADGAILTLRLARELGLTVGDAQGRYYEKASRGQSFIASTAAAGIAHGSALTATGALMLANPAGSGKNLSINRLVFNYVSGTLGNGQLWWCVGSNPASLPGETSAATRQGGLLLNTNAGDVAKAYSGVSLTTVPVIVRPTPFFYNAYAAAGITTSPVASGNFFEEVNGELVVPPGFFVAVEGIGTAGTSPLILLALCYDVISQ